MENEKFKFGDKINHTYFSIEPTIGSICECTEKDNPQSLYYRIVSFEKIDNGKYKTKMELIGPEKKKKWN
jgi:hypothetical protein